MPTAGQQAGAVLDSIPLDTRAGKKLVSLVGVVRWAMGEEANEAAVKKAVQRHRKVLTTVQHKFGHNVKQFALTTLQSLRKILDGMRPPGGFDRFRAQFPDVVTAMTVTCTDIVIYMPSLCSEQPAVVLAGERVSLTPPASHLLESWEYDSRNPEGAPVAASVGLGKVRCGLRWVQLSCRYLGIRTWTDFGNPSYVSRDGMEGKVELQSVRVVST
jgi:hypothetical protein